MQYIAIILIALIVSVGGFVGAYKYLPLGWLEEAPLIGATITTIQGSDTLSASRTVINNNFTALNAGKIENSTTSLPLITTLNGLTTAGNLVTVGTIASGIWRGTGIEVTYGGTGTTTPTANMVMVGNGASGLKVVDGFGTTGQFLTSNGASSAPTWETSAVNQNDIYIWTNGHYFNSSTTLNATTTILANSVLSSALVLNSISYAFPPAENASSSILSTDGAGSLSWVERGWEKLGETILAANAASMTVSNIPAANNLKINIFIAGSDASTRLDIRFNGDTGGNYNSKNWIDYVYQSGAAGQTSMFVTSAGTTSAAYSLVDVSNRATSFKIISATTVNASSTQAGYLPVSTYSIGSWNNIVNQISSVTVKSDTAQNFRTGSRVTVYGKRE